MTDTGLFPSTTPRFGLPFLYPGQAQKEVFVNEAVALVDALLHCTIEGEASSPPTAPVDGTVWLVAPQAVGEWADKSGQLACRQAGNWLFVTPGDGLRILDRATGQIRLFFGGWKKAAMPLEPIGGKVVDSEARAAIHDLVTALRAACVLPSA